METPQTTTKKGNGPDKAAAASPAPQQTPPVQPTQAIATAQPQAVARPKTFRELLEEYKPKLAQVMPRHLSADRLVRVTIACVNRTPTLLECTTDSLLNSVMQAAQLGLEPTGVLGSAYLVPYNEQIKGADGKKTGKWRKVCQLIVGYRGLIDLSRRSGQIESIEAHVVHANDRFTCRYGLDPVLEHEPCWHGDPGLVVAAYAVAKLKDGGKQIEVMTKAQLDKIKAGTQSEGKWGPWFDHEEEMQRKTLVRRIAKYLPLTPELADAFALEDEADRLAGQAPETPETPKGTAGLKALVQQKAAGATVEAQAESDVPHDAVTGEVHEGEPPAGESERIDPTAPAPAEAK